VSDRKNKFSHGYSLYRGLNRVPISHLRPLGPGTYVIAFAQIRSPPRVRFNGTCAQESDNFN
jgi:hypothetical protein